MREDVKRHWEANGYRIPRREGVRRMSEPTFQPGEKAAMHVTVKVHVTVVAGPFDAVGGPRYAVRDAAGTVHQVAPEELVKVGGWWQAEQPTGGQG